MKFTAIISALAVCASAVAAADSSVNVASVISDFYRVSTPHIDAKASTSLASALYAVETKWEDSPAYTSFQSALYSAAPTKVQSSIATSGYGFEQLTTMDWYTKSMPKPVQTAFAGYISSVDSAASKVIGTATSMAGAAHQTGMAVAGLVGVVGVMANL